MISSSQLLSILSYILAFSGWVKIINDWITNKPKIQGRIFNVLTARSGPPTLPEERTIFLLYLYITNARKNTVHILDYQLEIERNLGYERVDRVFGAHNIPEWTWEQKDKTMIIPNFPQKLITVNAEPVAYGIPLHGWLLFASEKPQAEYDEVKKWKVTCVDAFKNKHCIVTRPDQFQSLSLLQDITGIKNIPEEFKRK